MNNCKWIQDEFCVNADCPMRGDYCPVPGDPGVCRFAEQGDMGYIREKLGDGEILAQIAEECSEMAHAALKVRRAMSDINPTPLDVAVAMSRFVEEYSDVMLCVDLLGVSVDEEVMENKCRRWAERLRAGADE